MCPIAPATCVAHHVIVERYRIAVCLCYPLHFLMKSTGGYLHFEFASHLALRGLVDLSRIQHTHRRRHTQCAKLCVFQYAVGIYIGKWKAS